MTKKNRSTRITRGFTLLEVLIAVLILGIIATVAIPLLSDYAERAREARMVANVQALDRAVQRYELDHQAPWGFVYEPLSEDLYIPYNWEGGLGFVEQLEKPTDVYGNVLGERPVPPIYSVVSPVSELSGASLLLARGRDGRLTGPVPPVPDRIADIICGVGWRIQGHMGLLTALDRFCPTAAENGASDPLLGAVQEVAAITTTLQCERPPQWHRIWTSETEKRVRVTAGSDPNQCESWVRWNGGIGLLWVNGSHHPQETGCTQFVEVSCGGTTDTPCQIEISVIEDCRR